MPNGEFEEGPSRSHTRRPSREPDGDDLRGPRGRSPQLLPVSEAAAAYRLVYGRVDALIRGRTEVAELTVPACPAWTIRQSVAHLGRH